MNTVAVLAHALSLCLQKVQVPRGREPGLFVSVSSPLPSFPAVPCRVSGTGAGWRPSKDLGQVEGNRAPWEGGRAITFSSSGQA